MPQNRLYSILAAAGATILVCPRSAEATTITVNTTADELNSDGDCSLREAIQAANNNAATDACPAGTATPIDEIIIPAGTYTLTRAGVNENNNSTGDLDILASVTLTGRETNEDLTIIQAGTAAYSGIDRVLHLGYGGNRTIVIRNLTIQNGCANGGACGGGGGGVEINTGGTVEIVNCTIQNNRGGLGGGLHPYTGDVLATSVTDTIIRGNRASVLGGGVASQNTTTLTRVSITGNDTVSGGNGGGVGVAGGTTRLSSSTISGNRSLTHGGGIAIQGFNNASYGTVIATNVTISGNIAEGNGGGLFVSGGVVTGGYIGCAPAACNATLNNVTIAGNVADDTNVFPSGEGGGVFISDAGSTPGSLTLRNTLIAGNTDRSSPARPDCANNPSTTNPDATGAFTSQNYNLLGDDSGCVFTSQSGDRRGTTTSPIDARLGSLASNGGATNTHLPASNSPAFDSGNTAGCTDETSQPIATDQRGFPRAIYGRCDIGAVEVDAVCGNNLLEGSEQCDGSVCCASDCRYAAASTSCNDNDVCTAIDRCTGLGSGPSACAGSGSVCGNGTLNSSCGEQCDDGNNTNGDRCSATCQLEAFCGNGIIEAGEQCDGGACCGAGCQFAAAGTSCNDGNVCTAVDACNGLGGGSSACAGSGSVCGNGVLNPSCGEQCDDGNTNNGDGCSPTCQTAGPASCGNNICDAGENDSNCPGDCPVGDQLPNLSIQSSPSVVYPNNGQTVVFTLTYSNLGAAAASGVVITADIPVSSTFSSASSAPTVWSCANGTGTGTLCTTAIGDLAAGASGTARFAVTMTATTRLYQVSTIQDDLSHGPDPDVTNNGVAFVNSQTYKSINLGPTRAPANISHVLVPSFYDGTQELPLLLLLHGLGSASYGVTYDATYDFRFSRGVNTRGYFLLLAKGTGMVRANVASEPYSAARPNAHWNATDTCCTPGGTGFQLTPATDVDDAAYLRGLIEQAIDTLNVDTRRIYASGYSNGAFMAYRLACEMPELITAIAPLAGATFQNEALCVGGEPVSVLHIHGTADAATRFYDYNYDHDNNPQTAVIMDAPNEPGAIQTIQRWAAKAGCDTSAGALVTGANINLLHPHNRTNPSTPVYVIGNGAETITRRYGANCQPGYAVELWEMVDQDHSTNFEYEAALLNGEPFPSERILDWLFARVRP